MRLLVARARPRAFALAVALAFAVPAVAACTPSIDRAAQADLDRRLAAISASTRRIDPPTTATPQPLAVGQWITLRQIDKEQRPSLSTLKIIGAQGDAFWLEATTDSYFGSSGMKMLVALGDRTDPTQFAIRKAFMRDQRGNVTEMPEPMIAMMRSTFQPVLDTLVIRWEALPQQDAAVAAGTFAGCYHGRSSVTVAGYSSTSDIWWHPEVPINGVVKTVGVGEPTSTELVDFGREGARSSF